MYAQRTGTVYLRETLGQLVNDLNRENRDMEIFSSKLESVSPANKQQVLVQNRANVAAACQRLLDAIVGSKDSLPIGLRVVAHHLWLTVKSKFPSADITVIGSFFFLRFLCPAIAVPNQAGIIDSPPQLRLARGLIYITKILQNMSNDVKFGQKELDMVPFNSLMEKNMSRFSSFLTSISSHVVDPPFVRQGSDNSYVQLRAEVLRYLSKLEPVLYMINV